MIRERPYGLPKMSMKVLYFVFLLSVFPFVFCEDDPDEETPLARYARPKCSTDIDCHANAFCFGNDNRVRGYCKCEDGYEMFTQDKYYECLKELRLGDTCKRDIQCQISAGPLAMCADIDSKRLCVCNSTISHDVQGTCYETKLLGDFCLVDENCLLPDSTIDEDKLAMCNFGICSCPLEKRPTENKKRCILSKRMDEKCDTTLECQATENAVCRTVCTCEAGFTRSLDGKKCLRAALLFNETCLENEQCSRYLERSVCKNGACSCTSHYHSHETSCRKDVKPGEACFDDGDCIIFKELEGKVVCSKGVCTCIHGKSYDDHLCLSSGSYIWKSEFGLMVICFVFIFVYRNC